MKGNRKQWLIAAAFGSLLTVAVLFYLGRQGPADEFVNPAPGAVAPITDEATATYREDPGHPLAGVSYRAAEILVRFDANATDADIETIVATLDATVKRRFGRSGSMVLIGLPDGIEVATASAALLSHDLVEASEPNFIFHVDRFANDPQFSSQWGLHNTAQNGGITDIDIDAPEAWERSTGSREFVIGVIDTGITYYHQDLNANVWRNPGEIPSNGIDDDGNGYIDDFYGIDTANSDSNPLDDHGHGTHVAGVIAAEGDNAIGVSGVMWTASVASCKFFDRDGYGDTAGAVECLDYFLDLKQAGVDIIATNNSWGGHGFSQILQDKIAEHAASDILFVAAAGNDGFNNDQYPHYPASFDNDNIIAVAAMDEWGQLAPFSNWGPQSVDIAAPGVRIRSTDLSHTTSSQSGTSVAAPFVTGIVGLVQANDPSLSGAEIRQHILSTGVVESSFESALATGSRVRAHLPIVDSDGDGMPDPWEQAHGLDPENASDAAFDPDSDGLTNLEEFGHLTDPNNADTDGDGLGDGDEVDIYGTDPLATDSDNDGLDDGDEVNNVGTDPANADSDGDAVPDGQEINQYGTNPVDADTDDDGLDDGWELEYGLDPLQAGDELLDNDGDGLSNGEEYGLGTNPLLADSDEDGLTDIEERDTHGTDPTDADSDGDTMLDGWEQRNGLDPLDSGDASADADGDGFSNIAEFEAGTDPNDPLSVPRDIPWSAMQGGAAHRGYTAVATANSKFRRLWQSVHDIEDSHLPAASGDHFLVVDGDPRPQELVSIGVYDGVEQWRRALPGFMWFDAPQVAGAQVSIRGNGFDYGLVDIKNGNLLSSFNVPQGSTASNRFVVDESSIIAFGDNSLMRVNRATGNIYWESPLEHEEHLYSQYPASNGYYVLTFNDGVLYVFSYAGGSLLHRIDTSSCYASDASQISIDGSVIAYVQHANCMSAFNLQTGEMLWEQADIGGSFHSVGIDAIYAERSGSLVALDKATGQVLWTWSKPYLNPSTNIVSSIDHVFVAHQRGVSAIDKATREEAWSIAATGTLALSEDGVLLINAHQGRATVAIDVSGDSDADGMSDLFERHYKLSHVDASDAASDFDADGLTNLEEYEARTDPGKFDTDSDGLGDGAEVALHGTMPNIADTDRDGILDGAEITTYGTHPLSPDSDGDGVVDGDEAYDTGTDPADPHDAGPGMSTYLASFETGIPVEWQAPEDASATWALSDDESSDGFHSLAATAPAQNVDVVVELEQEFSRGDLVFDFRTVTALCCQMLIVYLDGNPVEYIRALDWTTYRVAVPRGRHTIRFEYHGNVNFENVAYLDNVRFEPVRPLASSPDDVLVYADGRVTDIGPGNEVNRAPIDVVDIYSPRYLVFLTGQHSIVVMRNEGFVLLDPAGELSHAIAMPGLTEPFGTALGDYIVAGDASPWSGGGLDLYDTFGNYRETVLDGALYISLDIGEAGVMYALHPGGVAVDRINVADFTVLNTIPITTNATSITVSDAGVIYSVGGNLLHRHNADGSTAASLAAALGSIRSASVAENGDVRYVVSTGRVGRATAALDSGDELAVDLNGNNNGLAIAAASRRGVDTDGDQMPDWWERGHMLDDRSALDAALDLDGDSLTNLEEFQFETHPGKADSDDDGLTDRDELQVHATDANDWDTDGDGLADYDEVVTHGSDPHVADTDGDSLTDREEAELLGSNPLSADTDGDGMSDAWEVENNLDLLNSADAVLDPDNDGLTNLDEFLAGSDIGLVDTDGDTLSDGDEVNVHGTNPGSKDTDNDFINDDWEVGNALDPVSAADAMDDPDGDGHANVHEYYAGTDPHDPLSFVGPEAWVTLQGDAMHSGYVPISFDASQVSELWTSNLVGHAPLVLNPVVASDGLLFATVVDHYFDQQVLAVDGRTGIEQWRFTLDYGSGPSMPALGEAQVFVRTGSWADEQTKYRRFDMATGALLGTVSREIEAGNYSLTPIGTDVLAIGETGNDDAIISIDTVNDSVKWVHNVGHFGQQPLSADDSYVYFVQDSVLNALSRGTGEASFTILAGHPGYDDGTAPIADRFGNLYTVLGDRIVSFNLATRDMNWVVETQYNVSQPALANGVLYVTQDSHLVGYDTRSGEEIWRWSEPMARDISHPVVLTQTHAFVASSNGTFAINLATRSVDWSDRREGYVTIDDAGIVYIVGETWPDGLQVAAFDLRGDTDADGMPDDWEDSHGLDKLDATDASADPDLDGLTNLEEFEAGTNPHAADTDGDLLTDFDEINVHATNPVLTDTDSDGLDDYAELFTYSTDPLDDDTDDDRVGDGDEINLHGGNPLVADSDGDGFDDFSEVRTGSDPADASSTPPVVSSMVESFEDGALPAGWSVPPGYEKTWDVSNLNASDGQRSLRAQRLGDRERAAIDFTANLADGIFYLDVHLQNSSALSAAIYTPGFSEHIRRPDRWQRVVIPVAAGMRSVGFVASRRSRSPDGVSVYIDNIEFSPDADSDGMSDTWEQRHGLNPANAADAGIDTDADGLTNIEEFYEATLPRNADTDGDGLADGAEFDEQTDPANPDSDGDGMPDGWELQYGLNPLVEWDALTDLDSDGLSNVSEYEHGTNASVRDTDSDGIWDGAEVQKGTNPVDSDTDGDGMPDGWEDAYGLDPLANDAAEDPDNDGATNLEEYRNGTDPTLAGSVAPPPTGPPSGKGGGGGGTGPVLLLVCLLMALRRARLRSHA